MAKIVKVKGVDPVLAPGRRKTSVAQVRMVQQGSGKFSVNAQSLDQFFGGNLKCIHSAMAPVRLIEEAAGYDFYVKVAGGGLTGQAEAIRHGIARSLAALDDKKRKAMKKEGFLTRDARMVERKKSGRPKARKRFQYSKR